MQCPSVLSSSTGFSILHPHFFSHLSIPSPSLRYSTLSWTRVPLNLLLYCRKSLLPLCSTANIQSVIESETMGDESEFIDIGYLCNVHGLHGELRVKPTTDFPELRLQTPGKRWLRIRVAGKERIQEVELIQGRGHPGQKNWILSFNGIDTLEKAKQFVGSTLLVKENDRPLLEEGEFYIPDLVGMTVVLKETRETVGTVVNVFNCGSSDLLQVMLSSDKVKGDKMETGKVAPGPLVWVPFAEAIVPDVDMNKREMYITPPKGLLELNLRADGRSKKERRKLEWKQSKKLQQRVIAAKKKVNQMGQQHILLGLSFGDKSQKTSLANQIVAINFQLLQHAINSLHVPSSRYNLAGFINANLAELLKNSLRISKESLVPNGSKGKSNTNYRKGVHLMSKGKVAVILATGYNDQESNSKPDIVGSQMFVDTSSLSYFQAFLESKEFSKIEEWHSSMPLILVCPSHEIQSTKELFSKQNYFGFDAKKVWFLEEGKLPVFSNSITEENKHQILLKSPWDVLQFPLGSGGVVISLSSHNIVENLTQMGVEYVEISSMGERSSTGNPFFFGLVDSCEADIGIKILDEEEEGNEFDLIFSINFLKKITEQINKLEFYPVPKINSHVQKVVNQWIDVTPTSPNSFQFHCSLYSLLNVCPSDKICLMQIAEPSLI